LTKIRKTSGNAKRLRIVAMTGDEKSDMTALRHVLPQGADVHSNWSLTGTKEAVYLSTVAAVLRQNGRVVLSGQAETFGKIPHSLIVLKNISLAGKFMYSRSTVQKLLNLISAGLLEIGERSRTAVRTHGLDKFPEALRTFVEHTTWKDYTMVTAQV
jgi:D-arabinose 1-dehydrogenase-like Zn-dependent alcohol dehydrogenase